MITHNAEYARRMTSENIDNDAKERARKDALEKASQFNQINDAIQSAINGGRFETSFPCRFRYDVIDDVKLAGYAVDFIESPEDGWPGTFNILEMKAGRPKDTYHVFPKLNSRNRMSQTIRRVCVGIKAKIRKEKDPDKKAMWAIIGLEFNELLFELD